MAVNDATYNLSFHEILTKVNNAKDKPKKLEVLQKYDTNELRMFLKGAFDDKLEWLLPEGSPPYTPNEAPVGTEHTRLAHEYKGLYKYFKGGDSSLKGMKREQLFVQLLEGLAEEEANLLVSACNKDIQSKYRVTKAAVAEAFPQIEWGNRG